MLNAYLGSHALRHSHACRALEIGTPPKLIGDILGHRDPQSTSIYRSTCAARRSACARWLCRSRHDDPHARPLSARHRRVRGLQARFGASVPARRTATAEFPALRRERHKRPASPRRHLDLKALIQAWLRRPGTRKPVSSGNELGVLRQFCLHQRRRDRQGFVPDRSWAPQTESRFTPYVFSHQEVRQLLAVAGKRGTRSLDAGALRTLLLILYCTGLRFGEAVRLQLDDVDLSRGLLQVRESKGKARLVPFGADLARAIKRHVKQRERLSTNGRATASRALFLRRSGRPLSVGAASDAVRNLLRRQGLKPAHGRGGPRPYDFRHAFAVHRLTDWYRKGLDIHARLPWLSAYMGHDNVLGTAVYLHATPDLLRLASQRLARRLQQAWRPR